MYCTSNLLIEQWCTVTIIAICYGPEQFRILFISRVCHARSFARCVNPVQNILPTFEYVKIYWFLDNWIIRKYRFLMLCLNICIFFYVYVFVDAF